MLNRTRINDLVIGARLPDGGRLRIGVETKPKKITEDEVPSYVMDPANSQGAGAFEASSWEGGNEDYIYRRDVDGQWTRSMKRFA